jgi:serine protease AprX
MSELFQTPYPNDAARIHSDSWGGGKGSYNANCQEVDDFVWNSGDCLIWFAAGNDGTDSGGVGRIDLGSVSVPGTAKNCITVGASQNDRLGFDNNLTYGED